MAPRGKHRRGLERHFILKSSDVGMAHLLNTVRDQVDLAIGIEGARKP